MNSFFYIFLIVVAISVFSLTPTDSQFSIYFPPVTNESCEISNACAKIGGSCSGVFGDGKCNSSSANTSCCGSGLYCYNSSCVTDNMGDWCTADSQCVGGGQFVRCQNNTCTQLGLPGDDCTQNSDCYYYNSTTNFSTCNNSVCTGASVGDLCKPSQYTCGSGLYCNNANTDTCQYWIPQNQSCDANDICAAGSICSWNGKCVAAYSGAQGDQCADDAECSSDLICAINSDNTNFSCQATPAAYDQTTCTFNSTDCNNGTSCVCNTFTGDSICLSVAQEAGYFGSYCGSYNSDLLTCLGDNNCSSYYLQLFYNPAKYKNPTDTLNPNSCAALNCKSDYKKAMGCGCDTYKDVFGNCEAAQQYCGGFPLWAIIVIAIVGVILVLVVIVVIVMVMRKRRTTYDTIA